MEGIGLVVGVTELELLLEDLAVDVDLSLEYSSFILLNDEGCFLPKRKIFLYFIFASEKTRAT